MANNIEQFKKLPLLILSFSMATIFVGSLCSFFSPRWETNDDIAMSMMAHGYGIASAATPNILFSNVLWGRIVQHLPEINGVPGYSVATLASLVISGTAVIYGLLTLKNTIPITALTALLILTRPILNPQFTINAGFLMIGAVLCLRLSIEQKDNKALIAATILAFLSYLIRSSETLLVFAVALPIILGRQLLQNKSAITALVLLAASIVGAEAMNHLAYRTKEWAFFNELNAIRVPLTDYNADTYIKQRPDILEKYGYSNNDVDLFRNWFFIDRTIANPSTLRAMLDELGPLPMQQGSLRLAWIGVKAITSQELLPIVLTAALIALLLPSRSLLISWALFIGAAFAMGLAGRPGIIRVYVPLASLLTIMPLLPTRTTTGWRERARLFILLVATSVNLIFYGILSKRNELLAHQLRQELNHFPEGDIVAWGESYPFEYYYPVVQTPNKLKTRRIYWLSSFTHSPYSVSHAEENTESSFLDSFRTEKGSFIVAHELRTSLLKTYCQERMHGTMETISDNYSALLNAKKYRCRIDKEQQ